MPLTSRRLPVLAATLLAAGFLSLPAAA